MQAGGVVSWGGGCMQIDMCMGVREVAARWGCVR